MQEEGKEETGKRERGEGDKRDKILGGREETRTRSGSGMLVGRGELTRRTLGGLWKCQEGGIGVWGGGRQG